MAKTVKFISGSGVGHECDLGSASFEHMTKDGSFRLVTDEEYAEHLANVPQPGQDGFGVAVEEDLTTEITEGTKEETDGEPEVEAVDLSKLTRPQLIDEAAKVGIVIDADDKAQTKAVIIAAIEAKLAEKPE